MHRSTFCANRFHISNQAANRTGDIIVIHGRCADAWKLGSAIWSACALLGCGDGATYRTAPQTTSSEGEGFEKSVVQFGEISGL